MDHAFAVWRVPAVLDDFTVDGPDIKQGEGRRIGSFGEAPAR